MSMKLVEYNFNFFTYTFLGVHPTELDLIYFQISITLLNICNYHESL